jgi:hypothetical protein
MNADPSKPTPGTTLLAQYKLQKLWDELYPPDLKVKPKPPYTQEELQIIKADCERHLDETIYQVITAAPCEVDPLTVEYFHHMWPWMDGAVVVREYLPAKNKEGDLMAPYSKP